MTRRGRKSEARSKKQEARSKKQLILPNTTRRPKGLRVVFGV
jgi:hypothetical protein